MKRYYFILASLSSDIGDVSLHQDLRLVLSYIGNSSNDGQENLICLIDTGSSRRGSVACTSWTIHHEINDNFDAIISSWNSPKSPIKFHNQTSLADVIHSLSDQLPTPGTYLLDVVWLITKHESFPTIEEDVGLFGAVMRLRTWHKSFVTLCCGPQVYVSRQLADWCRHVPAHVVNGRLALSRHLFPTGVMWRGALQLTDRQNGASQCLEGFQLLSHHSDDRAPETEPLLGETLSIVSENSLLDVPPHCISPARYSLVLPPIASSSLLENSWKFLSMANSKKDYCYVLRLPLAEPDNGCAADFSTERWRRKIASGYFVAGDTRGANGWSECRYFLLVGDGLCTAYSAALYAMRDPTDYEPRACLAVALRDAEALRTPESPTSLTTYDAVSSSMPLLSAFLLEGMEAAVAEAQLWTRDRYVNSNPSANREKLTLLAQKVGEIIIKRGQQEPSWGQSLPRSKNRHATTAESPPGVSDESIKEDVDDAESWSERLFLRSLKTFAERERHDDSALMRECGVPLSTTTPAPASMLEAGDIRRIFDTDTKWEKVLLDSSKKYRTSTAPSSSILQSWPAARHCTFHGVYYNSEPSSESKQLERDLLLGRHVGTLDTLSSASVRTVGAEFRARNERFASRRQPPLSNDLTAPSPSPQPQTISPITGNGHINDVGGRHSERRPVDSSRSSKLRDWLRKGVDEEPAVEVRRSPRRKRQLSPTSPTTSRLPPPPPSVSRSRSATLNAVHLQKLRGAVLDALESHHVRVKHPLFRDCAKKLLEICRSFAKDVVDEKGSISRRFQAIADSQVKQVIAFVHQRHQRAERIRRSVK